MPSTEDHRKLYGEVEISVPSRDALDASVRFIEIKSPETYDHSVRTARICIRILETMHLDRKVGLFTGLLHDFGKVQCNPEVLNKKSGFSIEDLEHVSEHVLDGYRAMRGLFDFTAEVILWHHCFQANSYPKDDPPPPLHDYSAGTSVMIPMYGRILALSDFYDAIHRNNDKHGIVSGEKIREIIENNNRDLLTLVSDLYDCCIFDESLGTDYERPSQVDSLESTKNRKDE